jgi:hypothetical protein
MTPQPCSGVLGRKEETVALALFQWINEVRPSKSTINFRQVFEKAEGLLGSHQLMNG